MITLNLARGDNYESVPLRLPTTPGEVDEVFAALDAASRYAGEVQIIGVDSGVPSLAKHLKGAGLTDPDAFDKLNRLAEKIDGMDERQRDIFSGALDAESAGSLDDVLRVSDSLEAYTFVPNVRSDEELGRYVVVAGQLHGDRRFPEEAWPYLDFAKIGAEYFAGHGGAYTVSGYVMRREDGQQQVQESKPIFELYLLHGQIRYRLDLPAEELQLDMTKRRLGVEDFAQAAIYQTKCEMEPLAGLLPMDCVSVESANELARTIREMPDGDLLKYLAVLSVEPPADFPGALRLALELDDYERITEGSYSILLTETKGGVLAVRYKYASKGDTVTITVTPDAGYELDALTAEDKNGKELALTDKGDGKYTFPMPGSQVTVTARFKQTDTGTENPFTDISKNDYFYDAVLWAVEEGITSGTSDTTFSPNVSCTRAQMVTFLWRVSGFPKASITNPFTDVSADAYYYDAVLWAVEQGITGGTGDGKFSPDAPCTRAQMATFLWRAAGSPAPASNVSAFTDVPEGSWYAKAVQWAYEQNITNGTGDGKFSPDATCTRAQMVQMLKISNQEFHVVK